MHSILPFPVWPCPRLSPNLPAAWHPAIPSSVLLALPLLRLPAHGISYTHMYILLLRTCFRHTRCVTVHLAHALLLARFNKRHKLLCIAPCAPIQGRNAARAPAAHCCRRRRAGRIRLGVFISDLDHRPLGLVDVASFPLWLGVVTTLSPSDISYRYRFPVSPDVCMCPSYYSVRVTPYLRCCGMLAALLCVCFLPANTTYTQHQPHYYFFPPSLLTFRAIFLHLDAILRYAPSADSCCFHLSLTWLF